MINFNYISLKRNKLIQDTKGKTSNQDIFTKIRFIKANRINIDPK